MNLTRNAVLRLYNLVLNLTILLPGLKAVSSNASPGRTGRLSGGDDRGFLKEGVKACIKWHECCLLTSQVSFSVFTSIVDAYEHLPIHVVI